MATNNLPRLKDAIGKAKDEYEQAIKEQALESLTIWIEQTSEKIGLSLNKWGQAAGVGANNIHTMIKKYKNGDIKGATLPTYLTVVKLAVAAEVSLPAPVAGPKKDK